MIIDPYYPSKLALKSRSNRKGRQFKCVHCGFSSDADSNLSRNIVTFMRGKLFVNEWNSTEDEVEGELRPSLFASFRIQLLVAYAIF